MKTTLVAVAVLALAACVASAQDWEVLLKVGDLDEPCCWNTGPAFAAGTRAFLAQETGMNAAPGNPDSPQADQQSDDDYWFAGVYSTIALDPVLSQTYPDGVLGPRATSLPNGDEWSAERAFVPSDTQLRFHFNLPADFNMDQMLRIGTRPVNLEAAADSRFGLKIFAGDPVDAANSGGAVGLPVENALDTDPFQRIIRSADFNTIAYTYPFPASEVFTAGPGADNVFTLQGQSYDGDGGGRWLGMDYHVLEVMPVPEPSNTGLLLGIVWSLPLIVYGKKRLQRS